MAMLEEVLLRKLGELDGFFEGLGELPAKGGVARGVDWEGAVGAGKVLGGDRSLTASNERGRGCSVEEKGEEGGVDVHLGLWRPCLAAGKWRRRLVE